MQKTASLFARVCLLAFFSFFVLHCSSSSGEDPVDLEQRRQNLAAPSGESESSSEPPEVKSPPEATNEAASGRAESLEGQPGSKLDHRIELPTKNLQLEFRGAETIFRSTAEKQSWRLEYELTGYESRGARTQVDPQGLDKRDDRITRRFSGVNEYFERKRPAIKHSFTLKESMFETPPKTLRVFLSFEGKGIAIDSVLPEKVRFDAENRSQDITYEGLKVSGANGDAVPAQFERAGDSTVAIELDLTESPSFPLEIDPTLGSPLHFQKLSVEPWDVKGNNSQSAATGDIDRDGDVDAVVSRHGERNVSWINDGDAKFDKMSLFGPGSNKSKDLALGDVDGKNGLDVFVGNAKQGNRVYTNNGDGTFSDTGQSLGVDRLNQWTFGVELADFDKDGDLEAVTINYNDQNVIWENGGNGQFTEHQVLDSDKSLGLGIGDFDEDTFPDLYIANRGESDTVWLNKGNKNSKFEKVSQTLGSSRARGMAVGHINADSHLDVFVANQGANANTVWVGDGTGHFSKHTTVGSKWSWDVSLEDVNGDGHLDAAVGNRGSRPNKLWLNKGNGTFEDSGETLGKQDIRNPVFDDFDADGNRDIFGATSGAPSLIFLGDGAGHFEPNNQSLGTLQTVDLELADLDNDGDVDIYTSNKGTVNRIWLNDGNAHFHHSERHFWRGDYGLGFELGDINKDGNVDAYVATWSWWHRTNPKKDLIRFNDSEGMFPKSALVPVDATGGLGTNSPGVEMADLDGDGWLDAFVCEWQWPNQVLINKLSDPTNDPADPNGAFEDSGQQLSPIGPGRGGNANDTTTAALGNFDGKNGIDAYVVNGNEPRDQVWLNDGSGNFSLHDQIGSTHTFDANAADFDGDDTTDVFTWDHQGVSSVVWLNKNEDANFETNGQGDAVVPANTQSGTIGDLDGDGDVDAFAPVQGAAGGNFSKSDQVWLNDGDGKFFDSGKELGNSVSKGGETGDLDSDGDLDVVIAKPKTHQNVVWRNNDPPVARVEIAGRLAPGEQFTLDGGSSTDPDHPKSTFSFSWELVDKPDGIENTLEGKGSRKATFEPADYGEYTFKLKVTDPGGLSGTQTTLVRVNDTPRASASASGPVEVGNQVTLNGSGSSDHNHDFSALRFSWKLTQQPPGANATLNQSASALAKLTPQKPGTYGAKLTVSDPWGDFTTDSVRLEAGHPPEAKIDSAPDTLKLGAPVELDASGSSDPDGNQLEFDWRVTPNSGASLSESDTATPKLTLTKAGTYDVELTVRDETGFEDTATISVAGNRSPNISISVSAGTINPGETIAIDMSNSTDPDGDQLTFEYEVVSKPADSGLALGNKSGKRIEVEPSTPGKYVVRGRVIDESGAQKTRTVRWRVNASPEAKIQVSKPGSAPLQGTEVAETGTVVRFDATSSDDDLSSSLDFAWSLSKPSGSQANLQTSEGSFTSLIAQTGGEYTVTLEVTDEHGRTDTTKVTIAMNHPPKAKIQTLKPVITTKSAVPLKGQSSSDPEDGGNLNFQWSLESSPPTSSASIQNAGTMTARLKPDVGGSYEVKLTVRDSVGSNDSTTARFRANEPPKARIGRDEIEVNAGKQIQLQATDSADDETHQLEYLWTFVETPAEASDLPELEGPAPSFKLQKPGKYVLKLTVKDANGAQDSKQISIFVNGQPEFVDPTPFDPVEVVPGQKIRFKIAASDPDGDDLDIQLIDRPDSAEGAVFEDREFEWDPTYAQVNQPDLEFEFEASDGDSQVRHTVPIDVIVESSVTAADADDGALSCSDIDCGDGEVCHLGQCFDNCSGDDTCTNPDATCLTSGRCASDPCERITCGDGQTCYRGSCFSTCEQNCNDPNKQCIDGRCTAGACDGVECPKGQTCYQGSCFEPCESSDQCDNEKAQCVDSRCTTEPCAGVQCPADQTCYQGSCFGTCEESSDCGGTDESCIEGRCTTDPCAGVQCPQGESCFQGSCYGECSSDGDCEGGESQCIEGRCMEGPCAGVQCEEGKQCVDGKCQSAGKNKDDSSRSSGGCGCNTGESDPFGPNVPIAVLFLLGAAAIRHRQVGYSQ